MIVLNFCLLQDIFDRFSQCDTDTDDRFGGTTADIATIGHLSSFVRDNHIVCSWAYLEITNTENLK